MTGRVLREGIDTTTRPRVVVLLVLDGMRADFFDQYADAMPTLSRLRREGAWFPNTRINYLPTLTYALAQASTPTFVSVSPWLVTASGNRRLLRLRG